MTPLTSVIIVNYNAGAHLKKAVASALKLSHTEVILVDNASTDNSLSLLPQASNLTIVRNPANLGFAKAVALGVKKARGRNLCLLNPDARLTQDSLNFMQAELISQGGHAIIAPALVNPDGTPQPSCYRRQTIGSAIQEFWLGRDSAYRKYLPPQTHPSPVDVTVAAAWLLPRPVWDKLGGLSSKYFLYFEDLDFCDRARAAGIPIIYTPAARVTHHHGVSASTNPATQQLFLRSATLYHGWLKKHVIDLIIRSGSLLRAQASPKKSLLVWGISLVLVYFLATLSYFLLPARAMPSSLLTAPYNQNFLWWAFANFDGEHYLSIATQGYQTFKGQSQYAFFPLLPALMAFFTTLGLDLYLAGRLLTLTASLLTALLIGHWTARYFKNSLSSLWLIFLGTGSVFLYSIYTEPLFLLFVACTFYFSEQKRWSLAILTAALASATRVTGIFLFPYLILMLMHNGTSFARAILLSLPSLGGVLSYMLYLFYTVGNPLAFYMAQDDWGKANPTSPLVTISAYFAALTTEFKLDLVHLVVYLEVIVTLCLWYLLYQALIRRPYPVAYLVYCFGNLAMPLATGSLGSMPRFALACFPLLVLIPTLTVKKRLLLSSTLFLTGMIGTILFIRGYWYA